MATTEEIAQQAMTLAVGLASAGRWFDGSPEAVFKLTYAADKVRDWLGSSSPHPQVADIIERLNRMEGQMATLGETIALINERTNELAEVVSSVDVRINNLVDRLNAGEQVTVDQLTPLLGTLGAVNAQLRDMGNPDQPVPPGPAPDPVPAPDPAPTPEPGPTPEPVTPMGSESRGPSSRR